MGSTGSEENDLVTELRMIDGHAALVRYSLIDSDGYPRVGHKVQIFDADAGIEYWVYTYAKTPRQALDIARSLLRGTAP